MKVTKAKALPSLSRVKEATRNPVTVALVQMHWEKDQAIHLENLNKAIALAKQAGADLVCLPELTLSRYPADQKPTGIPSSIAEELEGPTLEFARAAAIANNIYVHASLFELADLSDGRGYNAAIMVNPEGELVAYTPKLHIPVTAGYFEDKYFAPGPNDPEPYPVYEIDLGEAQTLTRVGLPTCWDEWFPEVARAYSLSNAEVLIYPTAIGSEPDHPDFDTSTLWQQVIVGNGIANGTFMVVPNRWGFEGNLNFYGSSFISDPYGRVLVAASKDQDEVLVAQLDLDQRRDWLDLFPFLATRRPDTYSFLTKSLVNERTESGDGVDGGIAGVAKDLQ
jgi:N-carbamoylputrescine amidase